MSKPERTVYGVHPRTATRIVVSVVVFVGVAIWFHEPLLTLVGALSSGGFSGRRLTLFLLAALSALLPLLVATALADALYDRYLADKRR